MIGVKCETCGVFEAAQQRIPNGWISVVEVVERSSMEIMEMMMGGGPQPTTLSFCSHRCVAAWAYLKDMQPVPVLSDHEFRPKRTRRRKATE